MMESFLLVFLVYMLFCLIYFKNSKDMETVSAYECGFEPKSLTRMGFSYRFFLISILFVIFDVEIALMLPIPYATTSSGGVWIFIFFIFILVVGLLYEYYCGSLDWLDYFVSKA